MCKWQRVIQRHKGSPCYRIAHGWKDEFGSFNLETFEIPNAFREGGSSLYLFICLLYILIFFLIHIFSLSLSVFSFFSFLLSSFFYFTPLEL
jgi:hypothetical protein